MALARFIAIFLVVVALAVLGLWTGGIIGPSASGGTGGIEDVTIKGKTFHLEIAADQNAIAKGLLYRKSIADDGGMLFLFRDYGLRNFWMNSGARWPSSARRESGNSEASQRSTRTP